ncbi:MAG: hypothetical protein AB9834_14455 [Lentimicrobium sp.]
MESPYKITLLLVFVFVFQYAYCQNAKVFCKAVDDSDFRKVERIVKKTIKDNRTGQTYFNGAGSGNQINLSPCYDSIINRLKKQACVEDAFWDKCQTKEANYPGHSSIGIQFRTKTGMIEKCFLIQEGTTGQINLLGWRPKVFKLKKMLVYVKMYDCENFIEQQKENCRKLK